MYTYMSYDTIIESKSSTPYLRASHQGSHVFPGELWFMFLCGSVAAYIVRMYSLVYTVSTISPSTHWNITHKVDADNKS